MKNLHRKIYEIEIPIKRNKFLAKFFRGKRVFKFKQGKLKEILKMLDWLEDQNDISEYVFYFLNNICFEGKISKKKFGKIGEDAITKIFGFIIKTFGKGYFGKSEKKQTRKIPTSSFVAGICKKLRMSPLDFLEFTWEQIEYLVDGIVWNDNETTKKGKRENELKRMKDELKNTDQNESLKEIEKINKKVEDIEKKKILL